MAQRRLRSSGEAPVDGDSGRGHHRDEGNMSNPIRGLSVLGAHWSRLMTRGDVRRWHGARRWCSGPISVGRWLAGARSGQAALV
jgi:hypothetical protein